MNINEYLVREITPYLNPQPRLSDYDLSENMVHQFLFRMHSFSERQRYAIQIIRDIMTAHGKGNLINTVIELARVEQGIRELVPSQRDHVVHALLSFIVGIYVNERFLRTLWETPVDTFQWKLAGLFHDVGYPVELATKKVMGKYVGTINTSKKEIGIDTPDIRFPTDFSSLAELQNNRNAFDLIQDRLALWNLSIDAKAAYSETVGSGQANHGIISALSVLYLVDLLYQKYNPKREYKNIVIRKESNKVNFNQIYFERDVVSACTAIYVHSLSAKWFGTSKIDRLKAPAAFLLKISDILQEWERPSLKKPTGFSAELFNIRLDGRQLFLLNAAGRPVGEKMRHEIRSTLIAPDVQIIEQNRTQK